MTPSAICPGRSHHARTGGATTIGTEEGASIQDSDASVPSNVIGSWRNKDRTAATYASTSAIFAWRWPIVRNDENPVPIPMIARPPANSDSVAIALAMTLAWRVTGCVTPVAAWIRFVANRMAASVTVTSRHSN